MILKKIIKYLKEPKCIKLYLASTNIIHMEDRKFIELSYEIALRKKINIDNPKTFNEKLQWLKLYDRKLEYTKMVDKYEVKKYVKDIIGEKHIIATLGIWNKFEDIDFEKLPNRFVIKCTHDSGGVVICKDKNNFDKKKARKKINKALKKNYFYFGREWPYKNVKPRIIIEEYMEDANTQEINDYKFMCFNGKVKCSFVCTDRRSKEGLKVTFFDLNWNKLPFERHYPTSKKEIEKPSNYNLMIELSEKLAKNIPFIRVDWYEINGQVYFGELTFFPGCGLEEFTPEEWDYKLGDWIELPNDNGGI